ncbi:MAG: hypothetical protein M3337_02425, partial [Actinomycetota bacterium]|nr:hypothetical protein [Actinomycetota bacterium]
MEPPLFGGVARRIPHCSDTETSVRGRDSRRPTDSSPGRVDNVWLVKRRAAGLVAPVALVALSGLG